MGTSETERLISGSTDTLATLVFEKIDRATEDAEFIDAPALTRDIFEMEGTVGELLTTREFGAVCGALDFLIDEGSIAFNTDDGNLSRV